ncbi:hypothetical protein QFC20_000858 [Naganishia adeliensis]|uniref:Uncharacterized protein n=1 Tax=Naganishia adeliensis TaxID=92952 RepID=A0ACC2WXI6_9TREE|nr:hypothetical protein QFC20_000858 [Naganishia adeliensis]
MSFKHITTLSRGVPATSALLRAVPAATLAARAVRPTQTIAASASLIAKRSYASVPPVPATDAAPNVQPGTVGPKKSRWQRFRLRFARTTLFAVVTATGTFIYFSQKDLYPGEQLDQDPKKKTIVVLGNGWGATSFLKSLDNEDYNVVVISPRNYFLFSPLLPSVTVGTLEARSIIQPTRYITRHKKRKCAVYEAEATDVDPAKKTVTFRDASETNEEHKEVTINYDYLVYGVGAENQTFGIKGVKEYGCFLKELKDADKIRRKLLDCIETASFTGQSEEEINRLMHMVVVGGGPTGVEYAGELHDFLIDDLRKWYPEIADKLRITLIEALPNVLPAFSKRMIEYTESTFKTNKIDVMTRTAVKDVREKSVLVQDANKNTHEIPYGLLVWATGNTARELSRKLMGKLPEHQTNRRGILTDEHLRVLGAPEIYALGDAVAGQYAPTAQVASQQGTWLARTLAKTAQAEKLKEELNQLRATGADQADIERVVKKLNRAADVPSFTYSHQGSLAYIGSEKAIADLPFFNGSFSSGGVATMLFWRSAYISSLYSLRNRTLVLTDWAKVKLFGRDVSRE